MSLSRHLILAGVLSTIGAVTILVCHSAITSLMGIELMLNSANLVFMTFAWILGGVDGEIMIFFAMIVAIAEVVVGLATITSIFKSRSTTGVDDVDLLKD